MLAIAHLVAVLFYLGAAVLAAAPLARPVHAPRRAVLAALAAGVLVHAGALFAIGAAAGSMPLTGLGPALSFAGFALALTLLIVEVLAREVSLTVIAAPLAALPAAFAPTIGLAVGIEPTGARGIWLYSHIALSFVGLAAFATAAAAGAMYLVQRRELRSRRFTSLFRFFPPLATLDRVNHLSAIAGWFGLTLGVVLAATYSVAYHEVNVPQLVWGIGAWVAICALAFGRVAAGWQARRAALFASVGFAVVLLVYVALRIAIPVAGAGKFL